jgi:hypothetical protein
LDKGCDETIVAILSGVLISQFRPQDQETALVQLEKPESV